VGEVKRYSSQVAQSRPREARDCYAPHRNEMLAGRSLAVMPHDTPRRGSSDVHTGSRSAAETSDTGRS